MRFYLRFRICLFVLFVLCCRRISVDKQNILSTLYRHTEKLLPVKRVPVHIHRRNSVIFVRREIVYALVGVAARRINRNLVPVLSDFARAARLRYGAENVKKPVYAFRLAVARNGIMAEKSSAHETRLRR